MANKTKLYEYVVVDDDTPISKLSFTEQLRVFFRKITTSSKDELKRESAITTDELTFRADLYEFLFKGTEKLRKGENRSVKLSIPSIFSGVWLDVFNSNRFKRYYTIKILIPNIEYDIPYFVLVKMYIKNAVPTKQDIEDEIEDGMRGYITLSEENNYGYSLDKVN